MRSLRAYLLLQRANDEIDVSVQTNLEDVEAIWREQSSNIVAGAIHIGFWRPDTQEFSELMGTYTNRLLLSASAVHALPPNYRSSSAPVGFVDNLPFYLALSGWGYEIEDPSIVTYDTSHLTDTKDAPLWPGELKISLTNCEWLSKFSMEYPDMFKQAYDLGIVSEESYLSLEEQLPPALRQSLGEARFRWYCKIAPTAQNIFEYISFTPPSFQSLPISYLGLSARPARIMAEKSIHQIGDLSRYTSAEVFSFRTMGIKAFTEIGTRLVELLFGTSHLRPSNIELVGDVPLETTIHNDNESLSITTFSEALDAAMGLLSDDRKRLIMEKRMGMNGPVLSLETIGDELNLTKQGVNQIEIGCISRIRELSFWSSVMGPSIRRILSDRDDFMSPQGLEIMAPALKGAANSLPTLRYILDRFLDPKLYLVSEGGLNFVTEISQKEWDDAKRNAKRLLENLTDQQMPLEEARRMVEGLLVGRGAELRGELWSIASKDAHFADGRLVSYGRGAEQLVRRVLESSKTPLHYSEIHRLIQEEGHDYDERRIHAAAADLSVGLLYGRGTYGTMKHWPLNDAETRCVVSKTEEIIENDDPDRQWHALELFKLLLDQGVDCGGHLTRYILSIALNKSKSLNYLGRMVWASTLSRSKGTADRLDVYQAVVAILEKEGGPMPSSKIKQRLQQERGLGFFQIQPEGRLVRIGSALWGLMDRDVPFNEEATKQFLTTLKDALNNKGKGIHSTEIIEEVAQNIPAIKNVLNADLDPVLFFGLAQKSQGFSVSQGEYVYLSEWGGPRRLNFTEAVEEVLKRAGNSGITRHEGEANVAALLGRPFPATMNFSQTSKNLGALLDETTKRWTLPLDDENDDQNDDVLRLAISNDYVGGASID